MMKRSHSNTNQQQQQMKNRDEKSWTHQLLTNLFSADKLHIPSTKTTHYRNKITYNLPLQCTDSEESDSGLSLLADEQLNEVCKSINDWAIERQQSTTDTRLFREVMAKCSRDGSIMIRLTVQRSSNIDDNNNWNKDTIQAFTTHLTTLHPNIKCICYNETNNKARPTKDAPLHLIYGNNMYLLEQTPSKRLQYQISPDSFCEVNFEVEDLQYKQTVKLIQEYQGAILIVSGRDINSYGLGFGSIQNEQTGQKVFSEVVAVQHCPLVAKDAKANFEQYKHEVKATVLHLPKDEMADGVSKALEEALERQNHPQVVVVTTGGRKGLHPSYLNFLTNHQSIVCIIYNSCSLNSLTVDVEGFISGGLYIDDFKSYDFFAGTKYSASVLRLLRRSKTLILPIGPAGSGKSTLASRLVDNSPTNMCTWWQRDLEFVKLRNANVGMNKCKSLLHEEMLSFLRGSGCGDDSSVRILDSTNGNSGARALYLKEAKPGLFIVIVLTCSDDIDQNDMVDLLLSRTIDRLEGGGALHPSFPTTVDEQRKKHLAILKGIEYPSNDEVERYKKECPRTVVLECDISDVSKLSSLPFEIFMGCSLSDKLQQVLQ